MPANRPAIPAEIRRAVRQRCGFGCVLCGCPIYQIEHIDDWAETQQHRPKDLTLLCGTCHDKKTKGLTSKESVRKANANPVNAQRGRSAAESLLFEGDKCIFNLGNVRCTNYSSTSFFSAIMIDGQSMLGFCLENGHILLNLLLNDRFDHPILTVEDGELIVSTQPWDIEFVGQKLTIREELRRILFMVKFKPPSEVHVMQGFFLLNGIAVAVSEHGVKCLNNDVILSECEFRANGYGIAGGMLPKGISGAISMGSDVRRYPAFYPDLDLQKSPTIEELWGMTA